MLSACKTKTLRLSKGMTITSSSNVYKDNYFLYSHDSLNQAVINISGENIVIDFNGATLTGSEDYGQPDLFNGTGIYISGGKNITIKNLKIRGFKIGLMAEGVEHLIIENCDFSYNYRPKLHSIREREDITDWLSYHDNETDQWKRFGSGIYLKNCKKAIIRTNKASQNQNALLMTLCDSAQIYNNVFDFNSGLGIGLYRSSYNQILHNVLDFNIRGYSHGFYNRGQDSAGILAYEQCSNNNFAFNSATHSGDGFFLWAGNQTMDSGEGGCNDNLIYDNDFSYAPTNGIEVTFSSNLIFNNKLHGCRYGVWGGYSHHTVIYGNDIADNDYGIAIEHGNTNAIVNNSFDGDSIGIQLWERSVQPSGWGFAEKRNVQSTNYILADNKFSNVYTPRDIRNTTEVKENQNFNFNPRLPAELEEGLNAKDYHLYTGREYMKINEWGPYNYQYPLIWLESIDSNLYCFSVYCPSGNCEISSLRGFENLSKSQFAGTDTITAVRIASLENLSIKAIYNGAPFIDQFGQVQPKDKSYEFGFNRFEHPMRWNVNFYNYSEAELINQESLSKALITAKPAYSEEVSMLAYRWWRAPHPKVNEHNFITVAESSSNFEDALYEIKLTSDDGIRLYIDGELKLTHWDIHEAVIDSIQVRLNGNHTFRIEHFEGGGFATLDFKINPLN